MRKDSEPFQQQEDWPTQVIVGIHDFKIIWNRTPVLEDVQSTQKDKWGFSDFDRIEIIIDDRCPATRKKEILLHEILHCIIWAYAIDVPVNPRDGEDKKHFDEEEHFIQGVTNPMVLCFWMNPTVFEWIMEKERNHG